MHAKKDYPVVEAPPLAVRRDEIEQLIYNTSHAVFLTIYMLQTLISVSSQQELLP